ncbi:MAG: hypothetical protein LBR27_08690 [Bifidobacteriaceae bacterium]|jgi:hypothetical protein|nr:hypothetical protein [Bifidobacteriaceae bacterium]
MKKLAKVLAVTTMAAGLALGGGAAALGAAPAADPNPNYSASLSIGASSAAAGSAISVTARDFLPGEQIKIEIFSDPVTLGTLTTDSTGSVTGSLTLPETISVGAHTVRGTGLTSGRTAESALTVTAIVVAAGPSSTASVSGSASASASSNGMPKAASDSPTTTASPALPMAAGAVLLLGISAMVWRRVRVEAR